MYSDTLLIAADRQCDGDTRLTNRIFGHFPPGRITVDSDTAQSESRDSKSHLGIGVIARLYNICVHITFATEAVGHVGHGKRSMGPRGWESGTYAQAALSGKHVGRQSIQTFGYSSAPYTYRVGKIAVTLAAGRIVGAYLAEVERRGSGVHIVNHHTLHQPVGIVGTTSLPIGKSGVHDFGYRHIIYTPGVRFPVGGRYCVERVTAVDRQAGNFAVDIACGRVTLKFITHTRVDGMIDSPHRRIGMQTLMAAKVAVFGPATLVGHPQGRIDGSIYGSSLSLIRGSILAYGTRHASSHEIGKIVVSRRVGHRTSAIIKRVTSPYAAIGVIQVVAVRVEIEFFPR